MPRLTKAEILALTPEQIDQMSKTNLTQLKQITSDLQAINKKSYARMKAKGMNTGFVRGYEQSGGSKSVRGMSAAEVKAELKAQASLNKAKTRTVSGATSVYKKMVSSIDPEHKIFAEDYKLASKDDIKRFWDLYHKAKEVTGERVRGGHDASQLDYELSNIITDEMRSSDEALADIEKNISERYEDIYKERQKGMPIESNPFSITSE